MDSKRFEYIVPIEYDGKDVRTFLRRGIGLSSHILTLLRQTDNGITVDGKELRTIDPLNVGQTLLLTLPPDQNDIDPVRGELDILFEDKYLLAINKPSDMIVHPTRDHQTDTLANIVSYYANSRGESYTFRSPYRLDRDTSGIILIAKDIITYSLLGDIQKTYYAICEGKLEDYGTISEPIALKVGSSMVRCVAPDGKPAVTHYEVIRSFDDHSYLSLHLETGRTHQIRCHLSSIGHPLLGDDLYGGDLSLIQRHALHCGKVSFVHPIDHKSMTLESPLPADMLRLVE